MTSPAAIEPATTAETSSGLGRAVVVTIAALLALVLAAVLLVVAILAFSRSNAVADRRQAALNAAERVAVNFTSLDYQNLTSDFQRFVADTTPAFRQQYLTQSNQIAELIVKAKGKSVGTVARAALSDDSATSATAIVAVNEIVTNKANPKGNPQYYRFRIPLVKSGDRWLATMVSPI